MHVCMHPREPELLGEGAGVELGPRGGGLGRGQGVPARLLEGREDVAVVALGRRGRGVGHELGVCVCSFV